MNWIPRYRDAVERLARAVSGTPGDTPTSLRRAVEARSAALGGSTGRGDEGLPEPSSEALPPSLLRYVDMVALHAHKVTDSDVRALRDAGLSEDAIFELTISAALGAARGRLDRGLAALGERNHETESG